MENAGMGKGTGWVFRHGDNYYWVGAPDAQTAKQLVAKHNPEAAKTEPEQLGNGAGYIDLTEGTVLFGKVVSKGAT
jgi:hypothetical protein